MLTLNQQEVKEIQDYLNEIPTKYGLPLINYLNMKLQQSGEQVPQEVKQEEEKS